MKLTPPIGIVLVAAAYLGLSGLPPALGDVIFTNTQSDEAGTGFGDVLTILGVQATTSEYGSILWDGSDDVDDGDATNQSETQTVAALSAEGIDQTNMTLIFNINEGGDSDPVLTLNDFDLVFQSDDGTELFRESFDAEGGLPLAAAGSGNGKSGWIFDVDFTSLAMATAFFGTLTNRVGMEITSDQAIENTKGGAESFYVTARIPEPATIVHALLGLGILTLWWSKRRR